MGGRFLTVSIASAATMAVLAATSATAFGASPQASSARASATAGVVVVNTRLAYGGGAGAGTGTVLTSSGTVLTNNHVIRGAGSIRVTVPSTGRTYTATVAGYSVSKDVALLKLRDAAGLKTVKTANASAVRIGDRVTTVGNAGGSGLRTKSGRVTGIGESITVNDNGSPLTLTGLIETNASLEPGDSGGPMLSGGRVVGLNAAASRSFAFRESGQGYAIPINRALTIAAQIEAGRRSSTVHVGPTAFLGVSLATGPYGDDVDGALVEGVAAGSPAARAGIGANDLIVALAGRPVTSAARLRKLIVQASPGRTVNVAWIDPYEGRTSAAVRLVAGPPQ